MRLNLINKRKQEKLTQAEIAKILGITVRHYKALEAGTSDGSIKVWQRLRDLLNTSIDTLLEDTTKPGGMEDADTNDKGRN